MRCDSRILALGAAGAAAVLLAACAGTPPYAQTGPRVASAGTAPMTLEYGRVIAIEYVPPGTPTAMRSPNIIGAVVGGVAGAALGNQVGSGSGRDAATVLGGVAGAAVGSQVGQGSAGASAESGASPAALYRVTVQTDQGVTRTYAVGATGDLRVGDRVRVENNVISRS